MGINRKDHRKNKKSFLFLISISFTTLTIISLCMIYFIVFFNWKIFINNTIIKLEEDASDHILTDVETLVKVPLSMNDAYYNIIMKGIVNLNNENDREHFFAGAITSSDKEIYSFSYGKENGDYYGARRNVKGEIELYRSDSSTDGHSFYFTVTQDLTAGSFIKDYGKFDPRTRDWYKIAKEQGRPVFSPLYKHFIKDDLVLSAAYPIYKEDGSLDGVLGAHITLTKLNDNLKSIVEDNRAVAYIIEKGTGDLVANSSDINVFTTLTDGSIERVNILETDNVSIIKAYDNYQNSKQPTYAINTGGDKYHVSIKEYENHGLEWLIISSIPESTFTSEYTKNIVTAILLTILTLFVLLLFSLKYTSTMLKPIYHLVSTAKKLSNGELTQRATIFRNDEIGELAIAFNYMAEEINTYISGLEYKVSERTSELEKANCELKKSEEDIHLLLDSTAEGILGIDLNENFTFCNESCLQLLGYKNRSELIGKNLHNQIHYQKEDKTPIPIEECKMNQALCKGEKMYTEEECLWRADGTSFPVEIYVYPQYHEKILIGAVITFIDITERKKIQKELISAKELADAANVSKSQFLANMSHEIRTPMNGVIGFLQLLEATGLNAEQLDFVRTIAASTDSLMSIINDLLDISKIEAGKMELEQIPFDIKSVTETAVFLFDAKAKSKQLDLKVHIDSALPKYALGDPTKLKQIISNLVSNAIKFTETGAISIDVALVTEEEHNIKVLFTISDTGIGISEDEMSKLFLAFSQADPSSTRKYGGTGLGLAICKKLVGMMNGDIWLSSKKGSGSTFQFSIILRKQLSSDYTLQDSIKSESENDEITFLPSGKSPADKLIISQEYEYGQFRILLVEDNKVNVKFFVKLLMKMGLNCDLASNGEEAVRAFECASYDIIFMDCQMPIMDGYEATKKIRALERNQSHTIIIALTAYAMDEDKNNCLQAGMDDFINKPVKVDTLEQILKKYIPVTEKSNNRKDRYFADTMNQLLRESGFDREFCIELLNDFYEHAVTLVNVIKENMQKDDYKEIGKLIHGLKGSARTIRVLEIADLASDAESKLKDNDLNSFRKILEQIEKLLELLNKTREI